MSPASRGERAVLKGRVVAIDDNAADRTLAAAALAQLPDLELISAADGESGLRAIEERQPVLVLLDVGLPGLDGITVLKRIRERWPKVSVIMLTGSSDIRIAVEAIRLGAYHFLTKPVNEEELVVTARRALERSDLVTEVETLRERLAGQSALSALLGTSAVSRAVIQRIRQVAGSNLTVLIQGETGVGKELVARAIHEESARAGQPLVAIDCGALPDNLIESELFGYEKGAFSGADRRKEGLMLAGQGGTVFLDEIGNLPLAAQAKMLRVLQDRRVMSLGATAARALDVRFIAATNLPLDSAVRGGSFRQDLYYRLAEFVISVPPLRDRREEILPLARRLCQEASLELGRLVTEIDDEAARLLFDHGWPGNVRELRNVIRQAVLTGTDYALRADDLRPLLVTGAVSDETTPSASPIEGLRAVVDRAAMAAEKKAIDEAMATSKGNKSQAARLLQVDYKTLLAKIKRHGGANGAD